MRKVADRLLPLSVFSLDGEPAVPWRRGASRWFAELSYMNSRIIETLMASPEMGGRSNGAKHIFHQKSDDRESRKRIREQETEQVIMEK